MGPDRGVPDVRRDVDGATSSAQLRQVLWKGLKSPLDALAQHVQRHAFYLREVAHGEVTLSRSAWRDREATVTDNGCRHTQRGRGAHVRVPRDLRIEVGVAVDDTGH